MVFWACSRFYRHHHQTESDGVTDKSLKYNNFTNLWPAAWRDGLSLLNVGAREGGDL